MGGLMQYAVCHYQSPVGRLKLASNGKGLVVLHFIENDTLPVSETVGCPILQKACKQLDDYFAGTLQEFSLPLALEGTPFRKKVWQALTKISYGKTASYADIAADIGQEKAVRAVGNANHHNPVSIIVPCHRVIGKNGKMVGYAGGLERKEWLLAHEEKMAMRQ